MEETAQTYNAIYGDRTWEQITLGEMINKGGAAGRIFRVKGHPQLVAKIFHNLNKSSANREKLQAMLLNRPSFSPAMKDGKRFTMEDGNNYIQIAWPEALLENEYGFCVGYLMPLIDLSQAASLDHFMQKAIRQKLKLTEKYEHRLQAAYNLCTMVAALHEKGHYIVDLKPSNVYVYKQSMLIAILDCDGFSIRGENGRYPAEFVSEEYIYPEGMKQNCDQMGEEQDKFALAVILFKLLNNGIHPFSGVPRKQGVPNLTIQERIAAHHYAYGSWADLYQAPHPYSIHDYFAKDTLELFDRAFVKGMKRPSAAEWERHLRNLLQNLRPCKKKSRPCLFYFQRLRPLPDGGKVQIRHARTPGAAANAQNRARTGNRKHDAGKNGSGKAAPAPKADPRQPHYRRRGRRLSGLFRHAAFYVCPLGRNADKSGDRPADDRHYSDHERHPQNF